MCRFYVCFCCDGGGGFVLSCLLREKKSTELDGWEWGIWKVLWEGKNKTKTYYTIKI